MGNKYLIFTILMILLTSFTVADSFDVTVQSPTGALPGGINTTFMINISNPQTSDDMPYVTLISPGSFPGISCVDVAGYTLSTGSNYCNYTGVLASNTSEIFPVSAITATSPNLATHFFVSENNETTEVVGVVVDAQGPQISEQSVRVKSLRHPGDLDGTKYLGGTEFNVSVNITDNLGFGNASLFWNVNATPNASKLMQNDGTTFWAMLNSTEIPHSSTGYISIVAYDQVGNVEEINNSGNYYRFKVDTLSPNFTVSTPLENSVTYNLKPKLQVLWDEDDSGINLTSVIMYLDGVPVSLDENNNSVTYHNVDNYLDEGIHEVTVTASDMVSNNVNRTWRFTVNAPLITSAVVTYPYSGAEVAGTVPVSVIVDGTEYINITSVEIYVNDTLLANDTSSPYWAEWDTTSFNDGDQPEIYVRVQALTDTLNSSPINVTVNQSKVFYTREEVNATMSIFLQDYYNQTEVDNILNDYYNITDAEQMFMNSSEVNVSIETYLLNYYMKNKTNVTIETYLSSYYNQTEVDNLFSGYYNMSTTNVTIENYLVEYYNMTSTNETIVQYLNSYYNSTEIDNILIGYYNMTSTNVTIENYLSGYYNSSATNSTIVVYLGDYYNQTETNQTIVQYLGGYYNQTEVDTLFDGYYNMSTTNVTIQNYLVDYYNQTMANATIEQYLLSYYTKANVNQSVETYLMDFMNLTMLNQTYYNRTEIDALFVSFGAPDLSSYYNRTETNQTILSFLQEYYNTTEVNTTISFMLQDYMNITEVENMFVDYYNTTFVYNKTEVDGMINQLTITYYNTSQIDALFYNTTTLDSLFYNKTEVDELLGIGQNYSFWDNLWKGWNVKFYMDFVFDQITSLGGATDMPTVLSSINDTVEVVYQKDVSTGQWKSYDPAVPLNQSDLRNLTDDISPLYIKVNRTSTLKIQ